MRYSSAPLEMASGPKTAASGAIAADADGSVLADEAGLVVGVRSNPEDWERGLAEFDEQPATMTKMPPTRAWLRRLIRFPLRVAIITGNGAGSAA